MSQAAINAETARKRLRRRVAPAAPAQVLSDLDTQLMLQVREGNAEATNALVRRNFDRVAGYIARLVRDQRAVEDLTQDVFLRVLNKAEGYQPMAKFTTWLYRVATNTALSYLEQAHVRKRREVDPELGGPEVPDTSGPTPEQRMSLDELRSSVSAAIMALPAKQRIALALFQYEDLSYGQIATVLDTTVESVRNLLKRARETLRRELDGLR